MHDMYVLPENIMSYIENMCTGISMHFCEKVSEVYKVWQRG